MARRYARRKASTPYDDDGRLLCDRCGRRIDPWPSRRADVCAPAGWTVCIRQELPVLTGWRRDNAELSIGSFIRNGEPS